MTETTPTPEFDLDAYLVECRERMDALVAEVLAPGVRLGTEFDTPDGTLRLAGRTYPIGTDVEDVAERTAIPVVALLTEDGRYAEVSAWHDGPVGDDEWVRYERYSARGREGHGYVHAVTRRLVQAG